MWLPAALAALFSFKQKFLHQEVFFVRCHLRSYKIWHRTTFSFWLLALEGCKKMKPGHVYLRESASPWWRCWHNLGRVKSSLVMACIRIGGRYFRICSLGWGSGWSTVEEHIAWDREVMGLDSADCWTLSCNLSKVSLSRSLMEVQNYWCLHYSCATSADNIHTMGNSLFPRLFSFHSCYS